MQRLDRDIFEALHKTQDGRKAIALFIVLKSIYRAGGIPNYSANRIRKVLGDAHRHFQTPYGRFEKQWLVLSYWQV